MKYNRHNKAFTLAEVILAIGIMGIGMVFAACLFPAAIKETESTNAAMEGAIIAQNGLNVAQQMLHTSGTSNVSANTPNRQVGNFIWIDADVTLSNLTTSALGLSGFYPATNDLVNTPTTLPNTGFVLLLQQQSTPTEYLAISVSYRKRKTGTHINVESVPFPLASMEKTVAVNSSDTTKFVKNGLVIVDSNTATAGKTARIVSRKNNEVTIEHPLLNSSGSSLTNVIVINELDSANNALQETPILSATSAILTIN